jgi:hypothetical protein
MVVMMMMVMMKYTRVNEGKGRARNPQKPFHGQNDITGKVPNI